VDVAANQLMEEITATTIAAATMDAEILLVLETIAVSGLFSFFSAVAAWVILDMVTTIAATTAVFGLSSFYSSVAEWDAEITVAANHAISAGEIFFPAFFIF